MKLYISGPMSGKPAFNIPLFDEYAKVLRSLGHEVVSPAELDDPLFRELCIQCTSGSIDELAILCQEQGLVPESWGDLLARDVKLLSDSDIEGIVVIEGWKDSRGAALETFVARLNDLPIYELGQGTIEPLTKRTIEETHARAAMCMNNLNVGLRPIRECGIEPTPTGQSAPVSTMRVNLTDGAPGDWGEPTPKTEPEFLVTPELRERFNRTQARYLTGEVRVTSETGGQKGEKRAVIGDICPKALKLLAEVAGFGRQKYDRLNYLKGFEYSLAYDAAQRHLNEFWAGNETDEESGLPHLAHAAWQCLCLLAFRLRGVGKDDRP